MTRDEIVKLAQESGFRAGHITLISGDPIAFIAPLSATSCIVELERFAALVAAAEREACAKVCEDGVRDIGEAAIIGDDRRDASINACTNLAKRIRARNQPPRVEDKK